MIQCRLGKTVLDIYREALGELGVRLEVSTTKDSSITGKVEATGEAGFKLLAKVTGKVATEYERGSERTTKPLSEDVNDLRFVARILLASGRRLVIEDFHYLSIDERQKFAFDLKALWDYGVFVVIVGVWSEQNMLLFLNPDLTARVVEVPIVWRRADLREVFEKGGKALNLHFSEPIITRAISDCYENAGILQTLILGTLDTLGISKAPASPTLVDDVAALENAEMEYAEQLNPLYQQFATRVAKGIRTRVNSTGIYAHAMAAVLSATDDDLIRGVPLDRIIAESHQPEDGSREDRVSSG